MTAKKALPAEPTVLNRDRRLVIEVVDNGYVVRSTETHPEYKESTVVFTAQSSMLRYVREATEVTREEE